MKNLFSIILLFAVSTAFAQRVDETDTLQVSGRITLRAVMVDSISVVIPSSGQTHREVPTDKAVSNYVATQIATVPNQTISVASNTVTLSGSGGSVTIAGAGINTVGTAGTTITVTGTEVDGSTSNELQTISRTSNTNDVVLSNSGGTVKINDFWETRTVTWSAGAATATISGTIPANLTDILVTRNGLNYVVGTSGCSGCNVTLATATLTFPSNLSSGEQIVVRIAKQ